MGTLVSTNWTCELARTAAGYFTSLLLYLCDVSLIDCAVVAVAHRPDYDSRARLAIEVHKATVYGMGFGDA